MKIKPTKALQEKCMEIIAGLETEIQRMEAEVFFSEHGAVIVVPGEEGLYSGKLYSVTESTILSAEVGHWAYEGRP